MSNAISGEMRVISLIKVKGELDSNILKEKVLDSAKKLGIENIEIVETLGRVDYALIYGAKSIEDVNKFALEIRKIPDVVDSETLIGLIK
ncbi:MAG: hypothetical protein J7L38_06425 [Thermoproteales archaeon]|nr:hypothetical protein [Thermoproteales archaeon]